MRPPIARPAAAEDGFNLLPWRGRAVQRLRRRRFIEWCAAGLVGCVCAAPLVGWQVWERVHLDARHDAAARASLQLHVPLAEARRLVGLGATQRLAQQHARQQAVPLMRLLTLLDALALAGTPGVMLQQVAHNASETDLQATATNEAAATAWLGRLRALPDVAAVSVRELKRASAPGGGKALPKTGEPIRVTVRLVWRGSQQGAEPASKVLAHETRNQK